MAVWQYFQDLKAHEFPGGPNNLTGKKYRAVYRTNKKPLISQGLF
jgi:hypothetical protein